MLAGRKVGRRLPDVGTTTFLESRNSTSSCPQKSGPRGNQT